MRDLKGSDRFQKSNAGNRSNRTLEDNPRNTPPVKAFARYAGAVAAAFASRHHREPLPQPMFLAHNVQRVALCEVCMFSEIDPNRPNISILRGLRMLARWVHISRCLHAEAKGPGYNLATLFQIVESSEVSTIPAAPPKKHGWLPLLTVLFLISYGLMTMLIVEQGQTIESQRALIRELFRDSTELSAVKMKAQHDQRAQALAQNPSSLNPSTQVPSVQAPSAQSQSKQAPSTQAAPQQRVQNQTKAKTQWQMPSRPASDLADARRSLITL
jgi:hypothetical protein